MAINRSKGTQASKKKLSHGNTTISSSNMYPSQSRKEEKMGKKTPVGKEANRDNDNTRYHTNTHLGHQEAQEQRTIWC
jgi:hypothetical protein